MAAFGTWTELPEAERGAWLESLAAAQPELHGRLQTLIAADREAEDHSFLRLQDSTAAAAAVMLESRRLGPWLIERLIEQRRHGPGLAGAADRRKKISAGNRPHCGG